MKGASPWGGAGFINMRLSFGGIAGNGSLLREDVTGK